jgi:hypothetical protein
MSPRLATYREFWPFYVSQHLNPLCRRLHFVGTTGTIACWVAGVLTREPPFLLWSAVSGYAFAWVGHFFVEKNRPATFTYPLWSLVSDFRMYGLMLVGKMTPVADEVARTTAPARAA